MLAECGVFAGEVGKDKFEHPALREINDTILTQKFGARKGLPYGKLPTTSIRLEPEWHQRAADYVATMDREATSAGATMWVFKDPRITILDDLWIQYSDIVVGIFRNPAHVIDSYLSKRWISGFNKKRVVLDYWMRFNESLLRLNNELAVLKPVYVIDYNEKVWPQFELLCSDLGIDACEKARELFDDSRGHPNVPEIFDVEVVKMYSSLKAIANLQRSLTSGVLEVVGGCDFGPSTMHTG
jgi:hypothetical protein